MATRKPPHTMRASEIERFERNFSNWLNLDPAEAMYHRFPRDVGEPNCHSPDLRGDYPTRSRKAAYSHV